jgi:pyruvate dehydrogenase E1 component
MLVATPSGVTLGPEGGAHQSINPPLIALGQPGLRHYEPAFADELAAMMEEGLRLMQREDGESIYLRLTTRSIAQAERADDGWKAGALAGGYWLRQPAPGAEAALVYCGAIAPEAIAAWKALEEDLPGLGLLAVTSPDLLHRGWSERRGARWGKGAVEPSHVERLLAPLSPDAGLVTIIDGAPASLSWLGGVAGHKVSPLGVDRFGQTGNLADLYRAYRLDADAIVEAAAELFLD